MITTKHSLIAVFTVLLACLLAVAILQAPSYADEPDAAPASSEVATADNEDVESSSASSESSAEKVKPQEQSSSQQAAEQSQSSEAASADDESALNAESEGAQEADDKTEDEQTTAEDEERAKKIEELQKKVDEKIEKAYQSVAEANELANRLPDALERLAQAYGPLNEHRGSYSDLLAQGTALNDQIAAAQNRVASLELALKQTREQKAQDIAIDLGQLLRGEVDVVALETLPYLLGKLENSYEQSLAEAKDAQSQAEAQHAELDTAIEATRTQVSSAIHDGNVVAFEVESLCSEIRQHDKDATDALEELQKELDEELKKLAEEYDKAVKEAEDAAKAAAESGQDVTVALPGQITIEDIQGLDEAKQEVEEARSWHDTDRLAAQEQAGAWYDSIDALSSTVVDTPSFGVGDDFALSERVFVTKWGNAIDAFYANWSATVGQQSPMQGLGKLMARGAYKHRIDPRLCAAVSIVESSGGIHCIKPYNAWGWGAADSDPSGLAFGWNAWDEAIDAWHEGVATNGAGLANPVCLSSFGDIYCSTPIWAKNVAGYMMQIDELAEDSAGDEAQAGAAQEPSNVGSNAVNKAQLL